VASVVVGILGFVAYSHKLEAERDPHVRIVHVTKDFHITEVQDEAGKWTYVFKNGKKADKNNDGTLIAFVATQYAADIKFGEGVIKTSDLPIIVWIVPDEEGKYETPDERWYYAQRCTDGEYIWKSKIHCK
jgi:hypothetical protein